MDIFNNKPQQWGLRGDPEMWNELSKRLEKLVNPENVEEFNKILDSEFSKLINKGKKISNDVFWFEEFSQLGMSGGSVSIEWWINTGIPLLKKRYSESKRKIY